MGNVIRESLSILDHNMTQRIFIIEFIAHFLLIVIIITGKVDGHVNLIKS